MGGMDAMVSGHLTERLYAICRKALNCPWAVALSGALVGVLAVSLGLSWVLTWSDDRAFTNAAILMVAAGVIAGRRFSLSRFLNPSELSVIACTWTLLQPWIIAGLVTLMPFVPTSMLSAESTRFLVGLGVALPVWFVASWLSTSFLSGVLEAASSRWQRTTLAASMSFGFAAGIAISALLFAPIIGTWSIVACAVAAIVLYRLLGAAKWIEVASVVPDSQPQLDSQVEESGLNINLATMQTVAFVATGGLIAVLMRLAGQLMPNGWQVYSAEWMGLAIGFGVGQLLKGRQQTTTSQAPWQMLVPAAWGALLLATFPSVVGFALWGTASLTSITALMTFRVLLLAMVMLPVGYGMSGVMPRLRSAIGTWFAPSGLAVGFVLTQFCFEGASLSFVLATICGVLVLTSLVTLAISQGLSLSWARRAGIAFCCVFSLSVPLWSGNHNPALVAKLLFSTPSFVAHRIGWESRLLPMLDDAHAIYSREGVHGPVTVWRSHGLELHLRENGIPRAMISANTEAYPQFAPEVLQAVYPLVLVPQPNRVLLLGASGGVPLTTCLQFPTHEIVCAEDNQLLTEVIRGPIARETGFDPLVDERVRLVPVPPTLAVMAASDLFDVILSSPPPSSIVAGGAMFTAEHYRHASRCLAEGGIFCQRFQCVDYGPDPLRIVVQSMRQAFQEVVAIETAAGELLFLGTNSAGAFNPDDLANRLQASHVRQLLARSGLDWSALLNFPAYDHAALGEICVEGRSWTNAAGNGILTLRTPLELIRWAPKLQETQQVLTAVRTSPAPFLNQEKADDSEEEIELSRKSRLLEWLGESRVSPELLRRLSEVATQYKLVQENPESHWWEYRKALREQLQNRRSSVVQQVSHTDEKAIRHPEDEWRKGYFTALGIAARDPNVELIAEVAKHLQPYDPLISYFARQEIADLQSRGTTDPASELNHRLHVIYFAPTVDGSTRNVVTAIELLIKHPESITDPVRRYDTLNGLLQTLRNRWESRQSYAIKSAKRQLSDVDRSLVAVDKGIQTLASWHAEAQVSDVDWATRKQVIERILQRPLHDYRTQLQTTATRTETRNRLKEAKAIPQEAK